MKITKSNLPFAIIILGGGFFTFIALFIYILSWYNKDHSKAAKKIGIPMEKNVSAFFKEHQRFPTLEESEFLFEKLGCSSMEQTYFEEQKNDIGEVYQQSGTYNCSYNSKIYKYGLTTSDLNTKTKESLKYGAYIIAFSQGNTRCRASFNKAGNLRNNFSCQQFSRGNKLFGSH